MKIYINNETHKNLLFLDIENDKENLKQLSGILFARKDNLYELQGSLNLYIKDNYCLDDFFVNFTGITDHFLDEHGIYLSEAKKLFNEFLANTDDLLVVSHNLKNDNLILFKNGFDISKYDNYCTWMKSKELMPNNLKFNVEYLAANEGWYLPSPHDAFHDAWALIPIFSKLKELESENKSN